MTNGQKVTFHSFPTTGMKKKIWLAKIKRDEGPNFAVNGHTKICSRHFKTEDFRETPKGNYILMFMHFFE